MTELLHILQVVEQNDDDDDSIGEDEPSVASSKASTAREQKSLSFIDAVSKEIQEVMKSGQIVCYIVDLKKKMESLAADKRRLQNKDDTYKRALKRKEREATMSRLKENVQKNEDSIWVERLQDERDDLENQCQEQRITIDMLERAAAVKYFDDRQEQKAEQSRHKETKNQLEALQEDFSVLQMTCEDQTADNQRLGASLTEKKEQYRVRVSELQQEVQANSSLREYDVTPWD
jgi:hypothetical protein